jgi:WD40 repeat-containing protein SMU1
MATDAAAGVAAAGAAAAAAAAATSASVDSADVIRLMLQFCKENGLHRTLQAMQEESRVSLNTVDSLDGLLGDISHGRWDVVLQAVSYLALPETVQQDLYAQIVLELAELQDAETALHMMKETAPMITMKQDSPDRWLRLEALVKKSTFDPRASYEGVPKEKRRMTIGQDIARHVQVAPPSRLLALVGQAMKWQQHAGLLPKASKFDVFRGTAVGQEEEREQHPTMIGKTVRFGLKSHPECATFSPDGQYCVSGSVDGFIEVWDHQTALLRKDLHYQEEGSFMMHDKAVIAVAFAKDSELLATGSQDGQMKIWRVATGQCVRRFEHSHGEGITSISWSKDSTQLLTSSYDHTARAHGLKSGKTLKEYRGHTSYVNSAIYSRDNSKVITASSDGNVNVFDARTTEVIQTISPPPPPHLPSAVNYAVNVVILAPKSATQTDDECIYVCTRTNTLLLMNLKGQVLKSFSSGKRDRSEFNAMITSPRGEWLYGVAEDRTLYCFNTLSGELEQTLKISDGDVVGLCHHPSRNVVAAYAADGTMAFLRP